MELNINLQGKDEIEQLILIINIGFMTALKDKIISIDEVQRLFYGPFFTDRLKKLGISNEIIKLIHLACELEDVESLIPHELNNSIEEIKKKSIKLLLTGKNLKEKKDNEMEVIRLDSYIPDKDM